MEAKVVIIGAGIAGLKAAETLLLKGFSPSDVVILEAMDRVGGRVFTDKTSSKLGNSYDLGASWFHDSLSNRVLNDLVELNDPTLFDLKKDTYFNDNRNSVFSREGKLDLWQLRLPVLLEEFSRFVENYYQTINAPDMTLKEIFNLYVEDRKLFLSSDQLKYLSGYIRSLELWHGASWDDIGARYGILEHNGRDLYNLKGNGIVVDFLERKVSQCVRLNLPVKEIMTGNSGKRNIVRTEKDTFTCDQVLVTVSLGVLLNSDIKWCPPLPSKIQKSLESIHFFALGKVIFEFESTFWTQEHDAFVVLSDSALDKELKSGPLKSLPEPFTYPAYCVSYSTLKSGKQGQAIVLLTQLPLTDYLERHPEEAWTYYKPMLEKAVVNGKIQEPINTIVTSWTANKYVRGSYTGLKPNDDFYSFMTLISGDDLLGFPSGDIFFAGEHTVDEGGGCIHGAYISGEREALRILSQYQKH